MARRKCATGWSRTAPPAAGASSWSTTCRCRPSSSAAASRAGASKSGPGPDSIPVLAPNSFRLDIGDLRLLGVGLQLRLDELLELRRRGGRGKGARVRDALEDGRILLGLAHFGGEL